MNNDQSLAKQPFGWLVHRISKKNEKEKFFWLLLLYVGLAFSSQAQTFSTNRTPVGMEHNVLFNASTRYTVTQSGSQSVNLDRMFDGKFFISYTPGELDANNPLVIEIEGLPNVHTQTGAWVGWTTRGRPAKRFKIEGYNVYQGSNTWSTFVDYNSDGSSWDYSYMTKVPNPPGGSFTKLRFTFYESQTADGRLGLSELFFIHPEAVTPYEGLFDSGSGGTGQQVWSEVNGEATFMGNVGIGISNPTEKLHVYGNSKIEGNLLTSALDIRAPGESTNRGIQISQDPNTFETSIVTPARDLVIDWGWANSLRLGSSNHASNGGKLIIPGAKVGIGTNSPNEALHVLGNIQNTGQIYAGSIRSSGQIKLDDDQEVFFENNGSIRGLNDLHQVLFRTSENKLELREYGDIILSSGARTNNAETANMIVKSNGNVGIGKTSPTEKLDISGNIRGSGNLLLGTDKARSSGITLERTGNTVLGIWRNSADGEGAVLELGKTRGTSTFSNNVVQNGDRLGVIRFYGGDGSSGAPEYITPTVGASIQAHAEGTPINGDVRARISFFTRMGLGGTDQNMAERMRISSDGNIGIGTTAPTQKLSVDGKINAEEIILEDVDGADFVFEEDYNLRSLEETEQFIKANKHLPEIPSAAEMAEEGLAIKEMNILLLQKVEELTLHLIEKHKDIDQLTTRVNELTKEVKALKTEQ